MKEIFNNFHDSYIFLSKETNYKWNGIYFYESDSGISYTLEILNNSCTYYAKGTETYFVIELKCKKINNEIHLYFSKKKEGCFFPIDWIDKNKPFLILIKENNILYTKEPQCNGNRIPKILFRKKE